MDCFFLSYFVTKLTYNEHPQMHMDQYFAERYMFLC